MAFVPLAARGPASPSLVRWHGRASASKAPVVRRGLPALYVHQGSEPPPPAVVVETSAIMDIPTALIQNNFPTPNTVSSARVTLSAVGGGGGNNALPHPDLFPKYTPPC